MFVKTRRLSIPALLKLTETALVNDHPVVYMDHEDMRANVPEHSYIKESIKSLKIDHFPAHDPHYYEERDIFQTLLFCPEGEEKNNMKRYFKILILFAGTPFLAMLFQKVVPNGEGSRKSWRSSAFRRSDNMPLAMA